MTVTDGRLTLDAIGGTNTKINYVRVRSAAPVATGPSLAITNTQPGTLPDQVVFNRFQAIPTGWPSTRPLDTATVRVTNTGSGPADITSIATTAPTWFTATAAAALPLRLDAGRART